MADTVSASQRSRIMARVKSKKHRAGADSSDVHYGDEVFDIAFTCPHCLANQT